MESTPSDTTIGLMISCSKAMMIMHSAVPPQVPAGRSW
jgi:hypothetical protein